MPRVKVVVKHTQEATFDTGDLPVTLIQKLLEQEGEASFGSTNWGLADVAGSTDQWTVDSIEVLEK